MKSLIILSMLTTMLTRHVVLSEIAEFPQGNSVYVTIVLPIITGALVPFVQGYFEDLRAFIKYRRLKKLEQKNDRNKPHTTK